MLTLACLALRTALVSLGSEFGFGLARFELAASFAPHFHFAYFFFGLSFLYVFMCFLSAITPAMLVASRTFELLVRHVGS